MIVASSRAGLLAAPRCDGSSRHDAGSGAAADTAKAKADKKAMKKHGKKHAAKLGRSRKQGHQQDQAVATAYEV